MGGFIYLLFFGCIEPPVGVIALAPMGVPPLEVAPPLDVLLLVISLGLQVAQAWVAVR